MNHVNTTTARPSLSTESSDSFHRLTAWLGEGWKLFRRAPMRLFGLFLFILLIEGIVQLTVPSAGVLASKWMVAMIAGVSWLMLFSLAEQGRLRPLQAIRRVRGKWLALCILSVVQIAGFASQVVVGWLMLGSAGVDMLLLAIPPAEISALELGLIFAAGVPANTLLIFTVPRLLLDRRELSAALSGGVAVVLRHLCPVALLALLTAILVGLAPATFLLSVLLTGPFMFCVGFAAYRDIGRAL
jgi:hypothetical protein